MKQPSPPWLAIPASSASVSGDSLVTLIGRPPKWTSSAQRKMARLYVYTTLPLEKIVKVIHSSLPESTPGLDSANKKLRSLLDKEPRWLHPRTESDMGRRVAQLSYSPTRLTFAENAAGDGPRPPHDETLAVSSSPFDVKRETTASLLPPEIPFFGPDSAATPLQGLVRGPQLHSSSHPTADRFPAHGCNPVQSEGLGDDDVFSPFLRRTTCLSTSTDCTTGSFRQLLPGYSEPYIQTVKRLVKRFTVPINTPCSLSPMPQGPPLPRGWLDNRDGPRAFHDEPHPLPGDFLSCDAFATERGCRALPEAHQHGRCLCFDHGSSYPSPWVTTGGITAAGRCLLATGPTPSNVFELDCFGNTVLHFLAARAPAEMLVQVLQTKLCDTIINRRNTGGQTFLHVTKRIEGRKPEQLLRLLHMAIRRGFDMCAQDVYGRNVLHILRSTGLTLDAVQRTCPVPERWRYIKRDAFGLVPTQQTLPGDRDEPMCLDSSPSDALSMTSPAPSIDPAIAKEAGLLEKIRLASENPLLEDVDGGNGLHCLAIATLSPDSIVDKYCLDPGTQDGSVGKGKLLDSSSARLEFRRSLAAGLLDAGVDPNHYDCRGNTPLMTFSAELPEDSDYKTGPKILDLLVEKGANVHARNRAGETALHVAVRCGRKLAMRTLVRHGASVHARDAEGRSVLDVADAKMMSSRAEDPREYARHEACRAWLSSNKGLAVQRPTVLDEWGRA
ncbi:ankyrin repeats (3 copies) domain-containing protein [Hirsutella rhossiliensis]|uniref:Ankyrin repeats (3 copies) domain-containing protein n=1 Tax=Hirsutella rhossiliensis TaxID=111463 RepID=A0A9P8N5K2_9HYPO|nr:ankyrin repeats (3 copies) domain-containing protein [Hirsutella rhossiliensis]KAH0966356.1 ankyrin repeats (3 copies) domain-containing protein [Hirsutella rhossiliensis]